MVKSGVRIDHEQEESVRVQGVEMVLGGLSQVDVAEDSACILTVSRVGWPLIARKAGKAWRLPGAMDGIRCSAKQRRRN